LVSVSVRSRISMSGLVMNVERNKNFVQCLVNLNARNRLGGGGTGVDGMIILKCVLEKYVVKM
jgi:hypothetical protein